MRVLVTGGAGYIGSVFVRELISNGYQVSVIDRFLFGKETLEPLITNGDLEVIECDLRDADKTKINLDGIQAVFHLAGLSNDPSCDLNPRFTFDSNVGGTRYIADLAKKAGVSKFVLFSSCSVYGTGKGTTLTELSMLNPVSAYAESKVQAEDYVKSISDKSFKPTILRLATVFGYSPRMRFDLAVNLMTLHALRKKRIAILGGGKQWRPFVHVRDVALLCTQLLQEPAEKIGGETFNVGSNDLNYQMSDLAALIADLVGDVELDFVPDDEDKRNYHVCFDKAKDVLQFKPKYKIKEGVAEIVEHFRVVEHQLTDEKYYNIQVMKSHLLTPAILGGEPIRREFLPFALPLLGTEEEEEVIDTLRSGWITTGPRTKKFEEKLAAYIGALDCLAVSSCTAALHLALATLDIGPGDEVITTPMTFCSTANVIEHTGATPVFVDVNPDTLNIDPALVEKAITPRTKAIIAVHMAGYPCDMRELSDIGARHGIKIIEDAAHAIGSTYEGKNIGTISDFTCFSFYPIKNMTTIEGGAIVCKDQSYMERLRRLALHGMDRDAWKRYEATGRPHWYVEEPGFKYNMTDIQAAVGLHQIDRLPAFNQRRQLIAATYDDAFRGLSGFGRPDYHDSKRQTNNHLYIVKLELDQIEISRDQLLEALSKEGIGTGIHFLPVQLHPFYKTKYGLDEQSLPISTDLSNRIFSMPLYPKMTDADVLDCIRALSKLLSYYSVNVATKPEVRPGTKVVR